MLFFFLIHFPSITNYVCPGVIYAGKIKQNAGTASRQKKVAAKTLSHPSPLSPSLTLLHIGHTNQRTLKDNDDDYRTSLRYLCNLEISVWNYTESVGNSRALACIINVPFPVTTISFAMISAPKENHFSRETSVKIE